MIRWKEKTAAFAVHFLVTALLALAAAALIFLVWFPSPFAAMVGGTGLFLLVVGCDVVLGPLLSLVIYDSRKSRRELVGDYVIVGALQLAALAYGVFVVWSARPAWIVFDGTRYEVVAAADLMDADLAKASPAYRARPSWGPELVATRVPPGEQMAVLESALAGKDVHLLPRYYVPYGSRLDRIRERSAPLRVLAAKDAAVGARLQEARVAAGLAEEQVGWLPVHHRTGFWIALVDLRDGTPRAYLPINPYELAPRG